MEGGAASRPLGATPLVDLVSEAQSLVVLDHTDSIDEALLVRHTLLP
jgi:hypothetical protein